MTFLPGSPRRARAPATATALSDWLFSLVLPYSSPPPSGPPLLLPFFPSYPCTDAVVAVGMLPAVFSTISSPNWRAFRQLGLEISSVAACTRYCWTRGYAVASRKHGSVNGLIPTSPKKGGHRAASHGPAGEQRVVCLDKMGPEAAKSFPGQKAVLTAPQAGGTVQFRRVEPTRRSTTAYEARVTSSGRSGRRRGRR